MNIDIIHLTAPALTFLIHIINETFASGLHLSPVELSDIMQVRQVMRQILQPHTHTHMHTLRNEN